jgi:hypothetical protein
MSPTMRAVSKNKTLRPEIEHAGPVGELSSFERIRGNFQEGQRLSVMVAGTRWATRVLDAVVLPGSPRTIVTPSLACQLVGSLGRRTCTRAGTFGNQCGQTAEVAVALDGYVAFDVHAIIVKLPSGITMLLGRDVLAHLRPSRN